MPKIVISYRRADSAAISGRIFDRLTQRYGEESVFMDVDNIPVGTDFRRHIQEVLAATDIFIAVVGTRWGGEGGARIKEAADPVRVEVETALQRGVPVIPVLVDGARMPDVADLPASLQEFAYINAAVVDTGRDFRQHMERLLRIIDGIASGTPAGTMPFQPTVSVAAAALPAGAPRRGRRGPLWLSASVLIALVGWYVAGQLALVSGPLSWISRGPASPQGQPQAAAERFPSYAGAVTDEVGMVHPDTRAQLERRLAELQTKTGMQGVIALLRDLPTSAPSEFADQLAQRWQVGGDRRTGALLVLYPVHRRASLHVGTGAQDKIDRANGNIILQNVDKRLQGNDVLGALTHAIDDLTTAATGGRLAAAPADPTPVAPPAPPPTTYRVLANVSTGVQNMRTGPATKYPIVVAIPAGSTGITISGCRDSEDGTRPWCAARWRSYGGWISSCCIVDEISGKPPPVAELTRQAR